MAPKPARATTGSPDGEWRMFPRVPNLVRYRSTGTNYGRVKIAGKVFRERPHEHRRFAIRDSEPQQPT